MPAVCVFVDHIHIWISHVLKKDVHLLVRRVNIKDIARRMQAKFCVFVDHITIPNYVAKRCVRAKRNLVDMGNSAQGMSFAVEAYEALRDK